MAAGAAAWMFGGTPRQVEYAAEMGLEHHLGLTCDPVMGLVQIPCIERNAFAAMRAVDCAEYALLSDGSHRISFDEVVRTMKKTGEDLPQAYRETSRGGPSGDPPRHRQSSHAPGSLSASTRAFNSRFACNYSRGVLANSAKFVVKRLRDRLSSRLKPSLQTVTARCKRDTLPERLSLSSTPQSRIPDAPASIGEFGRKMMLWENLNLNLALNHNLRGIKIKIKIKIKKKNDNPFSHESGCLQSVLRFPAL